MSTQLWVQWRTAADGSDWLRWGWRPSRKSQASSKAQAPLPALHSGNLEQLAAFIRAQGPDSRRHTVLLLDGDELVTRHLPYEASERKHLARLLPFALETTLAVDLAQVHVAVADVLPAAAADNTQAVVAYTDLPRLQTRIRALEHCGLEVESVYALPALLPASSAQWTLSCEASLCHLHAPGYLCVSAEPALLTHLLDQLLATPGVLPPARVQVLAGDKLPPMLNDVLRAAGIDIHVSECTPWAVFDTAAPDVVNLRQGELAAPLRLGRIWQVARLPVLAAALAFAASLLVSVTETALDRQRVQQLETRIEQRYRELVPDGVLVDAAQQLRTQIVRLQAAASGPGVVAMLNDMAAIFAAHERVQMHSLSYHHNRASGAPELQMSISAPATTDILALGEQLTAAGWSAQAQNISRSGDFQQASLLIRGKVL